MKKLKLFIVTIMTIFTSFTYMMKYKKVHKLDEEMIKENNKGVIYGDKTTSGRKRRKKAKPSIC